jgi:hypothetical protein
MQNEDYISNRRKRRHGMAGVLAAARGERVPRDTADKAAITAQVAKLILASKYFPETLHRLHETNPELAAKLQQQHDDTAGPKKRAMTDQGLLDSHLD